MRYMARASCRLSTSYMQAEHVPVTLKDPPSGCYQCCVPCKPMEPFSTPLRGVPHLHLKSGLLILLVIVSLLPPLFHPVFNFLSPCPTATVEDASNDAIDNIHPASELAPALVPAPVPQPARPPSSTPVPPSTRSVSLVDLTADIDRHCDTRRILRQVAGGRQRASSPRPRRR